MICTECGAFFIRYPCPSCGLKEPKEDLAVKEDGHTTHLDTQTLVSEERLVKPSELKAKKEREEKEKQADEHLLRPSQMNPDSIIDPKERLNEPGEKLVKPSSLHGRSSVNPHLAVSSTELKHRLRKDMPKISVSRKFGESEKEYKQRVRETLLEVMSLLEKLME